MHEPAPLLATSLAPQPGRREVGPRTSLRVQFSEALDPRSLGPTPITVTDLRRGALVEGETSLEEGGLVLLFRARDGLEGETAYRVDVSPGLRSAAGGALDPAPAGGFPVFPTFYTTFSSPPVIGAAIEAAAESSTSILVTWSAGSDNATDAADLVYGVWLAGEEEAIDYGSSPRTVSSPGATSSLL
ncbi:MAG TPA: Ig-like domain-containing protein, partial [Planctomycetota bacterium]|nr:Ig-like domain-containing protein [Planctomycetota bacterium]